MNSEDETRQKHLITRSCQRVVTLLDEGAPSDGNHTFVSDLTFSLILYLSF